MQSQSILDIIFDKAFNQGNLTAVDELVSLDNITHTSSWGMPVDRLVFKQLIAMLRTAFPDLHCTIDDEIIQENKIAARWTMRGTHQGLFLGNAPTNKSVAVQGLIYACIENGKVIENWTMIDQMGMLQQLGLVPPPR